MKPVFILLFLLIYNLLIGQPCNGLDADAGPDVFTCDRSMPPQLMGSYQGMADKFSWTPTTYLSNPNILDPLVNAPPGRYKYKLIVEGTSTTNLIRNGDFEGGNSGFTHEYNYGSPGGPFGPGWLSVGTSPIAYNGSWTNCGDHTSGSGNQLIVDGSTTPNTKVWCQTVSVTSGRTYLFRFYVQSVYPVAPPQLSASANGTTFGSVSGGALCDWRMFEACFKANSGTVEMCIVETSGIGFGNDFAVDDIEMFEKCIDEDEVEVEIVEVLAKLNVPKVPKCQSDIFDLTAAGSSSGPFVKYEWRSDGGRIISQMGQSAKGQGSGTYYLKVIYDNGFARCEKEVEIEVEAADDLAGLIEVEGIANCKMDTIKLSLNVENGSGRYSYNWAPAAKIVRGSNDSVAYVLDAGLYKAIIIDKESGCQLEVDNIVISDTLKPQFSISGDTLLNCLRSQAILQSSLQDTTRYSWKWTLPDQTSSDKSEIQSNQTGEFTLIVTDKSNACQSFQKWNISIDTTLPVLSLGEDVDIDCIKTSQFIIPLIGDTSKSYIYTWTINGMALAPERKTIGKDITQTTQIVLELRDTINGCKSIDTVNVFDLRDIPSVEAGNNDTLNCKTTQLSLSGSSNKNNLINSWSTKNGNIVSPVNNSVITINKEGWYYFYVKDTSNQCENIDSVFITELKSKPKSDPGAGFTFACKDSVLFLDGNNSIPALQLNYFWFTNDGIIDGASNLPNIKIRKAGNYFLVVEDSINFCRDTQSVIIRPDQNSPVVLGIVKDTLDCIIRKISLEGSIQSSTGNPLDFEWTTTDGNIIGNINSSIIDADKAGTYLLKVTDKINGCTTSVRLAVLEDLNTPNANAGTDQNWNCKSTNITLQGNSNSMQALQYFWSTSSGSLQGNTNQKNVTANKPGEYFLRVVNTQNGCESTDTVFIIDRIAFPSVSIANPDSLTCIRKQVLLNGNNSSTGLQFHYTWKDEMGVIVDIQKQISVNRAGKYILEIIDSSNLCIGRDTVEVVENISLPFVDAGQSAELTCKIKSINLLATANNQLQISWSTTNGQINGNTNAQQINVTRPGTYYITVKDNNNGCENSDSVLVSENTNLPVALDYDLQQPRCFGNKGQIRLNKVIGGELPLQYYFNGQLVSNVNYNNLDGGKYQLKVIDKNGCEILDSFVIINPTELQVQLIPLVRLEQGSNYQITPQFSIPVDSITDIRWEPSDGLSCTDCAYPNLINFENENSYYIYITDKNGCTSSARIRLELIKKYIYVPNIFSPNGDGINDYFFPVLSTESIQSVPLMQIYDRWGEIIFEERNIDFANPKAGWDGKYRDQNIIPGVYIYQIEVEWKSGERQRLYGDITILR